MKDKWTPQVTEGVLGIIAESHRGQYSRPSELEASEPVAYRLYRKTVCGEWKSDDRYWIDGIPNADLIKNVQERSADWRIVLAYLSPQIPAAESVIAEVEKWTIEGDHSLDYSLRTIAKIIAAYRERKGS